MSGLWRGPAGVPSAAAAPAPPPGAKQESAEAMKRVEKRIDPSDLNEYTKEQFVEQYGGTEEW
eukprot:gene45299-59514_t